MDSVHQQSFAPLAPGRRVAVIGSGISGLGAAWLLASRYRVSLYERGSYFGGHTNTVSVHSDDGPVGVDMGFIVYNRPNYPNLSALFEHLGVRSQTTDMSFAASIDGGRIEYAGDNLNSLYAQRRHLVSTRFQRMVWDILRFNRAAKRLLEEDAGLDLSLGEFLVREHLGTPFREHYLLPMAAAIWSCPTNSMLEFPAAGLVRFFENHGLLNLKDRPQWHTVTGGSGTYVTHLLSRLAGQAHVLAGVERVIRGGDGVTVCLEDGKKEHFDRVVIATHADEALKLIDRPDSLEQRTLGAFGYQRNRAILHTDPALMPKRRRVWSSWNYFANTRSEKERGVSVTYWMNRLQRLEQQTPYLVSLNPLREPRQDCVIKEVDYTHPVFDSEAMMNQSKLDRLQGRGGIWFCGSYLGYGFHEDGLRSAVQVASDFGVEAPWRDDLANQPAAPAPEALA